MKNSNASDSETKFQQRVWFDLKTLQRVYFWIEKKSNALEFELKNLAMRRVLNKEIFLEKHEREEKKYF